LLFVVCCLLFDPQIMDDTSYVTEDEREISRGSGGVCECAEVPVKENPLWAFWQDAVFGRLEGESTDDDSDALVCEGLDEPNYISADHCYYPDNSRYELDSSDDDVSVCIDDPCCPLVIARKRAAMDEIADPVLSSDFLDDWSESKESVVSSKPLKG
jgi:hypothetical protein